MPGLLLVLQSVVPFDNVPPLSHAHEFEDVIVIVPFDPELVVPLHGELLPWKSSLAALQMEGASADCPLLCAPYAAPARAAFPTNMPKYA
jgi:hypothetical protein